MADRIEMIKCSNYIDWMRIYRHIERYFTRHVSAFDDDYNLLSDYTLIITKKKYVIEFMSLDESYK